jgi:hypothetical protein
MMSAIARNAAVLGVLLIATIPLKADSPDADSPDADSLRQRVAAIERLIASLQEELVDIQRRLDKPPHRKALTPSEAVEQFKRLPQEPITVEFGVEPVGYPDAPSREGDDPEPAISARWDNRLVGGGTLTAIVPPAVYRQLLLPASDGSKRPLALLQERKEVVRHIETHGIRVTGVLKPGGFQGEDYTIQVTDPVNVVLYIKGSGQ